MSNPSTEAACSKLIFTKFAYNIERETVSGIGVYRHKKALCKTKQ